MKRARPPAAGTERDRRIFETLERVRRGCDVAARVASDPVEFVHRYERDDDREIVALVASSMAFGNVKALRGKVADALERLGPSPATTADDPALVARRLAGWKHRVYRASDLAGLVVGARRVQRQAGSLGRALVARLAEHGGDLRAALAGWTAAIREAGGLVAGGARRGATHILADPAAGSAVKRLMLLLRWMARPADGVDLGMWDVPTSALVVPMDVHLHRLGRNLGFTDRATASWRAAEEITRALARFDAADPVKYDFALCHMGMLQQCPSRRDPVRCDGCGIRDVCRHWSAPERPQRAPARRTRRRKAK